MKKILIAISLLTIIMFLVSCAPGETFAGEAFRQAQEREQPKSEPAEQPRLQPSSCEEELNDCKNQLKNLKKDYEVGAYAISGQPGTTTYIINGQQFTLNQGQSEVLSDGSVILSQGSIVQAYAGGLRGSSFTMTNACPNNYQMDVYWQEGDFDARFVVNGQEFFLKDGQTESLSNGAKIILRGSISQNYAGGWNGAGFELIC